MNHQIVLSLSKLSQPVDDDLAVVTPQEWTRSDVQSRAMKTQVIESPKALPITCNVSLSKNGAPPLLKTPNWCALSLSAQVTDVESSCN